LSPGRPNRKLEDNIKRQLRKIIGHELEVDGTGSGSCPMTVLVLMMLKILTEVLGI
jgi:hypothetical protein